MSFVFNLGALLFAAGLAQNGLTSPAPNIPAIFGNLLPHVNVLGNGIASFASGGNAGSLTQALSLYNNGWALVAAIDSATNSIQALPQIPEDAGMAIYNEFLAIEPIIMQGFVDFKSKKDAINALLPASLAALGKPQNRIAVSLMALKSSVVKFKIAVLAVTSPNIVAHVQALSERTEAELDAVIAVYSS